MEWKFELNEMFQYSRLSRLWRNRAAQDFVDQLVEFQYSRLSRLWRNASIPFHSGQRRSRFSTLD